MDAQNITMITEETLKSLTVPMDVNGIILCREYTVELTKNGKEYIKGTLFSGSAVQFKAWGDSAAFAELKNNNYAGMPVYITSVVDEYKGNYSLTMTTIQAVQYDTANFLPTKYDITTYWNAIYNLFVSQVSPNAKELLDTIFTPELKEDFCNEFAAKSHHDSCKSGLLAHTYKVMLNLYNLLSVYPSLIKGDQNFKDILYLGVFLHDIGKTNEMDMGVYQDNSFVSHRYFGLEYIMPYKEKIIANFGESNYYNLVSIITQHHGIYGEPCASMAAFIVHTVDNLDAMCTDISDAIADNKTSMKVSEYMITI